MKPLSNRWIKFFVVVNLILLFNLSGYSQTCPADFAVCSNAPSFKLTGASPAGGTYTGPGVVSGGNFNPASTTAGIKTITYAYNDNGQQKSCTFKITVNAAPEVFSQLGVFQECSNQGTEVITNRHGTSWGYMANGDPVTTTWSGPGVTGNATTGFTFDPMAAGAGMHNFTGIATSPAGCPVTFTSTRWIGESPQVLCVLGIIPMCINEGAVAINNNIGTCSAYLSSGEPLEISWSGPGVTGDLASGYTFDPALAGPGMHQLNAVATDGNCPVTYTSDVAVDGILAVSCTANLEVRVVDPPFVLTSGVVSGTSAFNWPGVYSGPGVNSETGVFDPSVAGEGVHNILFTHENNCAAPVSCSFTIKTTTLPVTLTKFNAKTAENSIILNWQTTEETNFDRFELERSSSPKKGFAKIHTINGSNGGNNYSFTDQTALKGIPQYYSLKMVDTDGTFAYSKIEWALIEGAEKLNVYPNPASKKLNIQSEKDLVEVKLVNVSGVEVWSENLAKIKNKELELPSLPSGTYLLKAKNVNGTSFYSRILIE